MIAARVHNRSIDEVEFGLMRVSTVRYSNVVQEKWNLVGLLEFSRFSSKNVARLGAAGLLSCRYVKAISVADAAYLHSRDFDLESFASCWFYGGILFFTGNMNLTLRKVSRRIYWATMAVPKIPQG